MTVEEHGDWIIWHDPLPIEWRGADWHYARKSSCDPNDIGNEESRAMCLQTIDYIEEQEREAETEEGQRRTSEFVDSAMQRYRELCLLHDLARSLKSVMDLPRGDVNLGFMGGTHLSTARENLKRYAELYPDRRAALSPEYAGGGNG